MTVAGRFQPYQFPIVTGRVNGQQIADAGNVEGRGGRADQVIVNHQRIRGRGTEVLDRVRVTNAHTGGRGDKGIDGDGGRDGDQATPGAPRHVSVQTTDNTWMIGKTKITLSWHSNGKKHDIGIMHQMQETVG